MSPQKSPLLLGALLLAWSAHVHAQKPEVVHVTASRIPQELHAIGSSVTVIDLDDWGGPQQMLTDVLHGLEGIHINSSGGIGQLSELRMRGGESNHVLVLLDGVELNDPSSGAVSFAQLDTTGIARIEILRGAQSALWGSHAISGVIHLSSRDGGFSRARVSGGSDAEQQVSVQFAHEARNLRVNTSLQYHRSSGEVTAPGGHEEDDYRNRTAQIGLRWAPSAALETRVSIRHTQARTEYDGFDFANLTAVDQEYQSHTRTAVMNAAVDADAFGLQQQWSLEYLQSHSNFEDRFPQTVVTQRVRARGLVWKEISRCPGGPCTLGAGAEWSRERYSRSGITPLRLTSSSLLGILKWQPLAHVHADVSLRRDNNHDFQDARTWRASVAWRLPELSTRLYLASGSANTNPTLTERFGYFPDFFIGNPDVKPERARTHEIGGSYDSGRLCCSVDLRYFYQRLEDEIGVSSDFTTVQNLQDDSYRRGVELEWRTASVHNWTVSGGYTWLRATEEGASRDRAEARRARHQYQLALEYHSELWDARLDASTVRGLKDFGRTLDNHRQVRLSLSRTLSPQLRAELHITNALDESWQEVLGYEAPDRNIRIGLVWQP